MKARKSCWTCTARKIQCDGGRPTCNKCARAQRVCQQYEMRLSWPRDDDKRRAIVGNDALPVVISPNQGSTNLFFINTTWQDVELYNHLSLRMQPCHLVLSSSDGWRQPQLRASHMDLVRYFHNSAYLSLVTFGATTSQIRDVLMSMALVHDTVPGLALLYALLAFSSLHRNGPHEQAVQLKISALHFLSASLKDGPLISVKAAQHVAAPMLLGAFEILLPLGTSGEWLWHIWGAMDMIQATTLKDQSYESATGHLLDWVYYHDALSRFAVQHWRHESFVLKVADRNVFDPRNLQYPPLARYRPVLPSPNPRYAILNLLSELCATLLDPRDPRSRDKEYRDRLRVLERRIDNVPITSVSARSTPDATFVADLYQMATRIYLIRSSQSPRESSQRVDSLIADAFTGAIRSCACEHFFPLLILACEARRDEQRVAILNLLDRTERDTRIRSVQGLKNAILSIWAQQDLNADSDLMVNYIGILSAAISSSKNVPSFV